MKSMAMVLLSAFLVLLVGSTGLSASPTQLSTPAGTSTLSSLVQSEVQEEPLPVTVPIPVNPPGDLSATWLSVSAGGMHTCGIHTDGGLECWGDNSFGQLNAPQGQFVKLSAGLVQNCAIKTDGLLLCWGAARSIPARQPKGKFKDVSAGNEHTCAIRADDRIVCWGHKTLRQTRAPVGRFAALSAGGRHTCALRLDGRSVCWGEKSFMTYERPAGRFRDIATGEDHACALRDDDRVVCWGNNTYGVTTPPEGAFKSVVAGSFHSCGLRFDSTLVCWGRNDLGESTPPARTNFKLISAGGAHGCGIKADDTLGCWGSSSMEAIGDSSPIQSSVPYDFLSSLSGLLGAGLTLYGKGVEKNWTGPDARMIKVQMGMVGASILLSAAKSFLPKPDDPVLVELGRMASDIAELKLKVGLILDKVDDIGKQVTQLSCNQAVDPIRSAGNKISAVYKDYLELLDQSSTVLTSTILKASNPNHYVPDIRPQLKAFSDKYETKLTEQLNAIHGAVVPDNGLVTTAISECMKVSLEKWRSGTAQLNGNTVPFETPFDDRLYYEPVWKILATAIYHQNTALLMLQDIKLRRAEEVLNNAGIDYSPRQMAGYCAIIRDKAKDKTDPKWGGWDLARIQCDGAKKVTDDTYRNMVKQIEFTGAPYTGKDTVLSVNSSLLKKGSNWANRDWLWVRDVDDYGITKVNFSEGLPPSMSTDPKHEFRYYDNWTSAGQAWIDVEDLIYHQISGVEHKDLTTTMRDKAGFKNITDRVFWAVGKTFNVRWNELADYYSDSDWSWNHSVDDAWTDNMKCFVASGLTHAWGQGSKDITGIVCKQHQMRRFTWRTTWENEGVQDVGSRESDNNGYSKYVDQLGKFYGRWKYVQLSSDDAYVLRSKAEWIGIQQAAVFFPDRDAAMYHWPVLNINDIKCTKSMVEDSARSGRKFSENIPARCGDDLDRLINSIVPRPDYEPARVSLPPEVSAIILSGSGSSKNWNCSRLVYANMGWAYEPFQYQIVSPSGKSVTTTSSDVISAVKNLEPDGNISEFSVRCGTNVTHYRTGTRYEINSAWKTYNRKTNELKGDPF